MSSNAYTCFNGHRRIASGPLQTVVLMVKAAIEQGDPVLTFDDSTGRVIDIDTEGSGDSVIARLGQSTATGAEPVGTDTHVDETRRRGRPKLGVIPREVTLLPRHWEWLETQPGGASVALRKLVEEARRDQSGKDRRRKAQERAYRFLAALAGNLPEFEEATRALFANDQQRFSEFVAAWPADVRDYAIKLAFDHDDPIAPEKN